MLEAPEGSRVAHITAGDVVLRGLTLRGGEAEAGAGIDASGGGTLTLLATVVTDNAATKEGGGIRITDGALLLDEASAVRANTVDAGSTPSGWGGGVSAIRAPVTVTGGSVVEANTVHCSDAGAQASGSECSGGGLWVAQGDVVLDGSEVRGNSVRYLMTQSVSSLMFGGGGLRTTGELTLREGARLEGNRIEFDLAPGVSPATLPSNFRARGGGAHVGGLLEVFDSAITDNEVVSAGAQSTGGGASCTDFLFERSELVGNAVRVTSTSGAKATSGGVAPTGGGAFLDSRVADNLAFAKGTASVSAEAGAVGLYAGTGWTLSQLVVRGSTLSGNRAVAEGGVAPTAEGGAVHAYARTGDARVEVLATNSTFSGNAAVGVGTGGAIFARSATGRAGVLVELTNATVTGNQASSAGALYVARGISSSTATLRHALLAGNEATTAPDCQTSGAAFTVEAPSLLGTDGSCAPSGGGVTRVASPGLGVLGDNGGFTPTHALLAGSAAVDLGTGPCVEADDTPLTVDQRGVARSDDRCDAGAFERVP